MPIVYASAVDATLLNTQKQDVFDMLLEGGSEPHQFEWASQLTSGSVGGPPPTQISILRSKSRPEFHFAFDFFHGNYHPRCSPWANKRFASLGAASWPSCLLSVQEWAQHVQDELKTADPWQALPGLATTTDIALASNVANTEFSHRETERLASGLNQIKRLLFGHIGKSTKQAALVENDIKALLNASERMGRKDWTNLAIGTIFTLALQLALPQEIVKQSFEILKQALTGLVPLVPHVLAAGQRLT